MEWRDDDLALLPRGVSVPLSQESSFGHARSWLVSRQAKRHLRVYGLPFVSNNTYLTVLEASRLPNIVLKMWLGWSLQNFVSSRHFAYDVPGETPYSDEPAAD